MNKIAVVYKSRYGSTAKYAKWIAEELKADLYDCYQIDLKKLQEYSTIIYGVGLYASGIAGVSIITKNYDILKNKKIIVFTVGLASTDNKEIFIPIIDKNFPTKEMKDKINFFHFRGGIDYKKLGIIHKFMMAMLKGMQSRRDVNDLSPEDKEFLATYGEKIDFTDKDAIKPLIQSLRS